MIQPVSAQTVRTAEDHLTRAMDRFNFGFLRFPRNLFQRLRDNFRIAKTSTKDRIKADLLRRIRRLYDEREAPERATLLEDLRKVCEKHGAFSVEGYSNTEWLFHDADRVPRLKRRPTVTDTQHSTPTDPNHVDQDKPPGFTADETGNQPAESPANPEGNADGLTATQAKLFEGPANVDWTFEGEDDADYTYGPPRMVEAWDGEKGSAAIVLTMDLSHRIQEALLVGREVQQIETAFEERKAAIFQQEQRLFSQILQMSSLLESLEDATNDEEPQEELVQQIEATKAAMELVEAERTKLGEQENSAREELERAYANQRVVQARADVVLENIFVSCNLLPKAQADGAPDTHILDMMREPLHQPESFDSFYSENVVDFNDDQKQAIQNLHRTKMELMEAENQLYDKENRYDAEFDAWQTDRAQGKRVVSRTAFDLAHLQYGQELTRKVIEAGAAFVQAKAEVQAAGVAQDYLQESNFVDSPDDGYRESLERAMIQAVDKRRISSWLEDVPMGEDGVSMSKMKVDVDDWDVRLDDPLDSISVLAEGPTRTRIDQWQMAAGGGWRGMTGGESETSW